MCPPKSERRQWPSEDRDRETERSIHKLRNRGVGCTRGIKGRALFWSLGWSQTQESPLKMLWGPYILLGINSESAAYKTSTFPAVLSLRTLLLTYHGVTSQTARGKKCEHSKDTSSPLSSHSACVLCRIPLDWGEKGFLKASFPPEADIKKPN